MTALPGIMLSILMLAAIALVLGGVRLLRTGSDRRRAVLMLICAVVLFANVLIWTI